MPLTGVQKLAVICLPVGATMLGVFTSGPEWNPKSSQGSWRERLHPSPKAAQTGSVEVPPKPPEPAKPEKPAKPVKPEKGGKAPPAPATDPVAIPAPPAPAPGPGPAPPPGPAPATPPAEPAELPYRIAGLTVVKSSDPLTVPERERLDLAIMGTGTVKIRSDLVDAETVKVEIRAGAPQKKSDGLLWILPHSRSPWNTTQELLAAGASTGWMHIACGVARASDAGQARVMRIDVPATEAPTTKGLDILRVVVAGPATPSWSVNGEACATPEALAAKVAALHKEYEEGFEPGYSENPDETPWILEGEGASAGGVLTALDALRTAGVKAVRIAGVVRKAP